jgi:hypothetical protein
MRSLAGSETGEFLAVQQHAGPAPEDWPYRTDDPSLRATPDPSGRIP